MLYVLAWLLLDAAFVVALWPGRPRPRDVSHELPNTWPDWEPRAPRDTVSPDLSTGDDA